MHCTVPCRAWLLLPPQLMSDAKARQEAEKERGEKRKGMDRLVGNARIKVRVMHGTSEWGPPAAGEVVDGKAHTCLWAWLNS